MRVCLSPHRSDARILSAVLVPFLPVRDDFHPKRNQARQKLATLPTGRFKDLSSDVYYELARRYPEFKEEVRILRVTIACAFLTDAVHSPRMRHLQRRLGPLTMTTRRQTSRATAAHRKTAVTTADMEEARPELDDGRAKTPGVGAPTRTAGPTTAIHDASPRKIYTGTTGESHRRTLRCSGGGRVSP